MAQIVAVGGVLLNVESLRLLEEGIDKISVDLSVPLPWCPSFVEGLISATEVTQYIAETI